ncbi:hypothetical protein [Microbulbifer sp. TYP-18]|uniref:hypothetical protein n=1 Tax=Microbulbifer sp. TYP-18 TaxID=3230024 RepID=UPI0034C6A2D8
MSHNSALGVRADIRTGRLSLSAAAALWRGERNFCITQPPGQMWVTDCSNLELQDPTNCAQLNWEQHWE